MFIQKPTVPRSKQPHFKRSSNPQVILQKSELSKMSSYAVGGHLPKSDPLRFSSLNSTKTNNHPPQFVFFRARPGSVPAIRSSLNDTVSEQSSVSFYDLLGIPETGTLLEIKQAYKQLARKYHPDVSPPDRVHEYTQRFIRVQEAYETLSDPRRRELYDRDMANGVHLAFTARKRSMFDEQMEEKSAWKRRWQSQLSELKIRSMQKDSEDNVSWAAQLRRDRKQSS